ncbi:hypothetical protein [Paenibacillus pabuli]|nr:hypothetical protein [Paenibacillus pabuli]
MKELSRGFVKLKLNHLMDMVFFHLSDSKDNLYWSDDNQPALSI